MHTIETRNALYINALALRIVYARLRVKDNLNIPFQNTPHNHLERKKRPRYPKHAESVLE